MEIVDQPCAVASARCADFHVLIARLARAGLTCAVALAIALPCLPQDQPTKSPDLTNQSLEELMNIEVTSVSKKGEKLSRTASAVFVITQEDIRRSGANNIPDLLRMVPGLDVALINQSTWAISARGLNDEFANELLVLEDGRNVYTPTFGGVFWDTFDIPLENIERIEVIRGPGAAVWGANAANGVINIITKKASKTLGGMVSAGTGNVDQASDTLQYGTSLGKSTDARAFLKYSGQASLTDLNGENGGDGWHALRTGFRSDTNLSPKDTLMLQGDLFFERAGGIVTYLPSVTSPGQVPEELQQNHSGGFIQGVWNHATSSQSDFSLNLSFTNYQIDDIINTLREGRGTFSADFQDHFAWRTRHDFVWGLGFSDSASHSVGNLTISLNPAGLTTQVFSAFGQDEIAIIPDRLYVTLGGKLEHNYYTGFGLMPNARASYSFSKRKMAWAAYSRALRTPDSLDTGIRLNLGSTPGPNGTPVLTSIFGNPQFGNEGVDAFEVGYRASPSDRFSFDIAAYYNDYDRQQTLEPETEFSENTPAPPHVVMPFTYKNLMDGEEHGIEGWATWKVTDRWTLSPGYDFARIHMHTLPGSQDTESAPEVDGSDPHMHAQLRSHVQLARGFAWDASSFFTDRLIFQGVPSYTRLDTNVSWNWRERFTLSIVGQNLLQAHHVEFEESVGGQGTTRVARAAFAKLMWRF